MFKNLYYWYDSFDKNICCSQVYSQTKCLVLCMLFSFGFASAQEIMKKTIYVEENQKIEEDLDAAIKRQIDQDIDYAAKEYSKILKISSNIITAYRTNNVSEFKTLLNIIQNYKEQNFKFQKKDLKNNEFFYVNEIFNKFPSTFITPHQLEKIHLQLGKPISQLWQIANENVARGLYIGMREYVNSLLAQIPIDIKKKLVISEVTYQEIVKNAWTYSKPEFIENFLSDNPLQIHRSEILSQLGDLYFSLGRMDEALDSWLMQQRLHGGSANLVAKQATAAYLNNDLDIYQHFYNKYRNNRSKVFIGGQKTFLGKYLRKIPRLFKSSPTYNWISYGGNSSHNSIEQDFSFSPENIGQNYSLSYKKQSNKISLPIFADDHLYLRLPNELICYSLNGILAQKKWTFSGIPVMKNSDKKGVSQINIKNLSNYMSATYANGVIYFFSGEQQQESEKLLETQIYNKIYALDAKNGKILWTWKIPGTHFSFAPVIIGNKLYTSVTRFKGQTNIEIYCFDISDDQKEIRTEKDYDREGKILWQQFVGSALEKDYLNESSNFTIAGGLTAAYGKLYCTTNIGIVAAIDAKDGHIHWLNKYHSHVQQKYQLRSNAIPRTISWQNVPPIVKNGKLYVTPTDSDKIYIYNCFSGALERIYPDNTQNTIYDRVLGVDSHGIIYLAGISKYETHLIALQEDKATEKLWEKVVPGEINGLGLLGEKNLYFSTVKIRNTLHVTDIKTGATNTLDRNNSVITELMKKRQSPCESFMTFFQGKRQYFILCGRDISIIKSSP